MNVTIRPADPGSDFEQIARLLSRIELEPVTADDVREWERHQLAGLVRLRYVANIGQGIAGYGLAQHAEWMGTDRCHLWVAVDPDCRHAGIGTRLFDFGRTFAEQHGYTLLDSEVRDDDTASLGFAQRRGFEINRHVFESVLDLTTFDAKPFIGVIESVQSDGIDFITLGDTGNDPAVFRQLYDVNYRAVLDDPASQGGFASFEDFRAIVQNAPWFDPFGQIMAADGGQIVGLSAVGVFQDRSLARNMITGVERAYRGRRIGLALKLLAIEYARTRGVLSMITNNNSTNRPMLAINEKLGYRRRPGMYRLIGQLENSEPWNSSNIM